MREYDMKQKIISYMSMSIVMAVLLLTTPSSAQATTVVNSLYSKSSTGGHTVLSGEDGKDGEDGQDGKKRRKR